MGSINVHVWGISNRDTSFMSPVGKGKGLGGGCPYQPNNTYTTDSLLTHHWQSTDMQLTVDCHLMVKMSTHSGDQWSTNLKNMSIKTLLNLGWHIGRYIDQAFFNMLTNSINQNSTDSRLKYTWSKIFREGKLISKHKHTEYQKVSFITIMALRLNPTATHFLLLLISNVM